MIFNKKKEVAKKVSQIKAMRKSVATRRDRVAASARLLGGGIGGGTITSGEKVPGGLSHNGLVRIYDHTALRRNVRDAFFDSPLCRGMATRFADTIVDQGIRLRFEPDTELLGISREEGETWGREVTKRFHLYMASRGCSRDMQQNGYQMQWQYALAQQRDNAMYTRIHRNHKDKGLLSPVQIQFIDPDQLASYEYTSTDGVQNIGLDTIGGITYDTQGREVSYKFLSYSRNKWKEVVIPRVGQRSGKVQVLHGFRREYAGQKEGFPLYSHLLQHFEHITDFSIAHVQKAINQSTFGFYTKPSKNAPASGGVTDFATERAEVIKDYLNTDAVDGLSTESLNELTATTLDEFKVRTGTVWNASLGAGEDMGVVGQSAPADSFGDFVTSLSTDLSASSGMPISMVRMKLDNNYSANRAILILLWRIAGIWQAEMGSDFLIPWKDAWLDEEVARGVIRCPGWSDPFLRAAWGAVRLIGKAYPSMDPFKEANADKLRTELGHLTLDDGALGFNHSDGSRNRATLEREYEELPTPPWQEGVSQEYKEETEGDE